VRSKGSAKGSRGEFIVECKFRCGVVPPHSLFFFIFLRAPGIPRPFLFVDRECAEDLRWNVAREAKRPAPRSQHINCAENTMPNPGPQTAQLFDPMKTPYCKLWRSNGTSPPQNPKPQQYHTRTAHYRLATMACDDTSRMRQTKRTTWHRAQLETCRQNLPTVRPPNPTWFMFSPALETVNSARYANF